jgi:oligopeptide transport system ATP-binding protein
MTAESSLVSIESVAVDFPVSQRNRQTGSRMLRAVDDVTLTVDEGETLALVGESGCGKTTLGRTLLRIYSPARGRVLFGGADISHLQGRDLRAFRRRAQIIFQDPNASLNPRMKVEELIAEPLRAHRVGSRADRRERVQELLGLVGMPADAAARFPQSFSGGQRQRIAIARSLALEPEFLVADEPIAALDVSIQAQIVNLLQDLQDGLGLTLLFIAHDLAVVRHFATRVAVMYLGKVVEQGPRDDIFDNPRHPYTQSLLSAAPVPDPVKERTRERILLAGDIPSPISPPAGCRFHTRCPFALDLCRTVEPEPTQLGDSIVSCHLVGGAATVAEP